MHSSLLRAASLMLALSAAPLLLQAADAPAAPAPAAATAPAKDAVFTTEQLDQMLASIALYPDPLLAQVLMAATLSLIHI